MFNFQNLKVVRIFPRKQGIFAEAKYNGWQSHFDFFILPDGRVEGKTSGGYWQELTQEAARLICEKIKAILKSRSVPIL